MGEVVHTSFNPRRAFKKPCPAAVEGPFLGSDATHLRCAAVEGHEGHHFFHVEWWNTQESA